MFNECVQSWMDVGVISVFSRIAFPEFLKRKEDVPTFCLVLFPVALILFVLSWHVPMLVFSRWSRIQPSLTSWWCPTCTETSWGQWIIRSETCVANQRLWLEVLRSCDCVSAICALVWSEASASLPAGTSAPTESPYSNRFVWLCLF